MTTGGLLLWRQRDGRMAFLGHNQTDFAPADVTMLGEMVRAALPPPRPFACMPAAIRVAEEGRATRGDRVVLKVAVANRCDEAVVVNLTGVVRAGRGDDASQPTGEIYGHPGFALQPGQVAHRDVLAASRQEVAHVTWRAVPLPGEGEAPCIDIGASRCLAADRALVESAFTLMQVEEGRALLRTAAEADVYRGCAHPCSRTSCGHLADDVANNGTFELQRATMAQCVQRELPAYLAEGRIWRAFWGGRLPRDDSSVGYDRMNDVGRAVDNPPAIVDYVRRNYQDACTDA